MSEVRHNQDEWEELTAIINQYMNNKNWTVTEALNYMKGTLIKSSKIFGVKKHMWDKQCDSMKIDFDNWSPLKKNEKSVKL